MERPGTIGEACEQHLAAISQLIRENERFIPRDFHLLDQDMSLALASLLKVYRLARGYVLLARQDLWEEGHLLVRTIIETTVNCLWMQKDAAKREQLRMVFAYKHSHRLVQRLTYHEKFLAAKFPDTSVSPRMKRGLARHQAISRELKKALAREHKLNPEQVEKLSSLKIEKKLEELGMDGVLTGAYASTSSSVHSDSLSLGDYVEMSMSENQGKTWLERYDAMYADAVYVCAIILTAHVATVYPLFKHSGFDHLVDEHGARREMLSAAYVDLANVDDYLNNVQEEEEDPPGT